MGGERFLRSSYASYSAATQINTLNLDEIFKSRSIPQGLDPSKITLRESCDSAANPSSTPLIFGLDVTGSMGFIAETIVKKQLPDLIARIYEETPIADPHVMFMGIGDVWCDSAPLQVSQFEAGAIPLIEQLRTLWLEGHGGGNHYESYNLPWYFALSRTSIDSFTKRREKGYLFTIGDELPPPALTSHQLTRVFGPGQHAEYTNEALLQVVGEKYKVFHIIAEEGFYARGKVSRVREPWVDILGPNVINMAHHKHLDEIVVATLKIANGEDMSEVIKASAFPEELTHAFSNTIQGS